MALYEFDDKNIYDSWAIDNNGYHKRPWGGNGSGNAFTINTILPERIHYYEDGSNEGLSAYKCLVISELPDEQMYSNVEYVDMLHVFICKTDEATMTDEEVLLEMSNYDDIPSEPFISLYPTDGAYVYSMYGFAVGAHSSACQVGQQDTHTIIFNKLETIEKGTPITVYVAFTSEKDNDLHLKKFNTVWNLLNEDDEGNERK